MFLKETSEYMFKELTNNNFARKPEMFPFPAQGNESNKYFIVDESGVGIIGSAVIDGGRIFCRTLPLAKIEAIPRFTEQNKWGSLKVELESILKGFPFYITLKVDKEDMMVFIDKEFDAFHYVYELIFQQKFNSPEREIVDRRLVDNFRAFLVEGDFSEDKFQTCLDNLFNKIIKEKITNRFFYYSPKKGMYVPGLE